MIKFPKMHIAASTVNRILNVADGLKARPRALTATVAPSVPDPALQGAQLDQALQQPVPPVSGSPALGDALIGKSLGLQ
jgi:hypothetical protein